MYPFSTLIGLKVYVILCLAQFSIYYRNCDHKCVSALCRYEPRESLSSRVFSFLTKANILFIIFMKFKPIYLFQLQSTNFTPTNIRTIQNHINLVEEQFAAFHCNQVILFHCILHIYWKAQNILK